MPGDYAYFEESDDDFSEDDFPEEGQADDPWSETVPCPHCGADVYEDAERCPYCQTYITHDNRPWSGRPGWWILLGLAGVLATILTLLRCMP